MAAARANEVEFKSSATFDRETGNKNKELEFAVAKTVAGFANSHGGTLLIGVNDDGEAVGIERRLSARRTRSARIETATRTG